MMHRHGASCRCVLTLPRRATKGLGAPCSRHKSSKTSPSKSKSLAESHTSSKQAPILTLASELQATAQKSLSTSEQDLASMTKTFMGLLNRQTKVPDQWKHTHSLRGEEMRLKDAVRTASKGKWSPISREQLDFLAAADAEETLDGSDEAFNSLYLTPGTFVEVRRNNITTPAIVLGYTTISLRKFVVSMIPTGEIWKHRANDIAFMIPSHVPVNLAHRCGMGYGAISDIHLSARTEVLKRLRELVRQAELKYNVMWNRSLDVYTAVKSHDPSRWDRTTAAEVARMFEEPTSMTLLATYRYLMNNPLYFVARDPYLITQTFDVRPQRDVEEIQTINEWKRIPDGPIASFAKKSRKIIQRNETVINETSSQEPTVTQLPEIWSKDDKVVLSFLIRSLRPYRSNQDDPYSLGQSAIMRALDRLGPPVNDARVHSMLVKLGVMAPWQDTITLRTDAYTPPKTDAKASTQDAIVQKSIASKPPPTGPLGPEDFYPSDPLELVRHDFGDLPVFVIDDPTAKELDDGISIEEIPTEPGSYWVHGHIANPTASLPPTHVLAQEALKRGLTQYYTSTTIPLFPQSLVQHPEHGWSLGSTKETGKPVRVMTFSAKIGQDGGIADYKVRAGLIHNVRVVTYSEVNELLGTPDEPYLEYPFGRGQALLPTRPPSTITPAESKSLRLLSMISDRLKRRRFDHDGINYAIPVGSAQFGSVPPGTMTPSLSNKQFAGFPEFTSYTVESIGLSDNGSRSLVAEVMKLSGRVASKFALENGIPIIRRASEPLTFISPEAMEKALALRSPSCSVDLVKIAPYIASISGGEYTTAFKPHSLISPELDEGYIRATSPLRRALDLVVHWQFHHALLGSKSLSSKPMFDKDWLEKFSIEYGATEKSLVKAEKDHAMFWQLMFIKKWIDGTIRFDRGGMDEDPLKVLEGFVVETSRLDTTSKALTHGVILPTLGIQGQASGFLDAMPLGSKLPLRVAEIRLGIRPQLNLERR